MKKRIKFRSLSMLLAALVCLTLGLSLMPSFGVVTHAAATPTYKIVVTSPEFNRTYSNNTELPVTFSGSWLLSYMRYPSGYTVTSISKEGGDDIVSIDGTSVSVNGAGTVNLRINAGVRSGTVGFIVTKNITATAQGYTGAYDGNAHGISVSVAIPSSGATVAYGTTSGTYNLTSSPEYTDAGTYTVHYQVTADGYNTLTGSAQVKIGKATPVVTALPTASAITYGQTLEDSTLSGGTASVPGTFAWKTSSTSPTVNDSNSTAYPVVFTPNDTTNYNSVETAVKLTVNKATPTVTALPTASAITYGQTLEDSTLSGGAASHGSLQVPGTFTWKTPSAAPTVNDSNSTTFPIVFTPDDTTNYNSKNADLTVTVADVSFNAVDGGSQTYNKSDLIFRFMMDDDDADTYQYMETFKKATIKGPDIDRDLNPGEYTATSGSLKLTLMNSFLETLKPGTYTVTVYFVDETEAHSASANFTVPSSGGTDIPETDPSSGGTDIPETDENIMLIGAAMILVILSLSAIAYIMLRQRRYLTAKN